MKKLFMLNSKQRNENLSGGTFLLLDKHRLRRIIMSTVHTREKPLVNTRNNFDEAVWKYT